MWRGRLQIHVHLHGLLRILCLAPAYRLRFDLLQLEALENERLCQLALHCLRCHFRLVAHDLGHNGLVR